MAEISVQVELTDVYCGIAAGGCGTVSWVQVDQFTERRHFDSDPKGGDYVNTGYSVACPACKMLTGHFMRKPSSIKKTVSVSVDALTVSRKKRIDPVMPSS
jgi:hypothetical protein